MCFFFLHFTCAPSLFKNVVIFIIMSIVSSLGDFLFAVATVGSSSLLLWDFSHTRRFCNIAVVDCFHVTNRVELKRCSTVMLKAAVALA